jgi:hypothetical protein
MFNQAFAVLDAIAKGAEIDPDELQRWVDALKAIRWVVETDAGLVLTPAGRQARDDMASAQRRPEPPAS